MERSRRRRKKRIMNLQQRGGGGGSGGGGSGGGRSSGTADAAAAIFFRRCKICRHKATQKFHSLTPILCDVHYDSVKALYDSTMACIEKIDEECEKNPEAFDWR